MSLIDFQTRRLMPDDDHDPYPGSEDEAATREFHGRAVTELTAGIKVAAGLMARTDLIRDVHELRRQRPVTEREVDQMFHERRVHHLQTLLGVGDEIAYKRGLAAWEATPDV